MNYQLQLDKLCAKHNLNVTYSRNSMTVHGDLRGVTYTETVYTEDHVLAALAHVRTITADWQAVLLKTTDGKIRKWGRNIGRQLPRFTGLVRVFEDGTDASVWLAEKGTLVRQIA